MSLVLNIELFDIEAHSMALILMGVVVSKQIRGLEVVVCGVFQNQCILVIEMVLFLTCCPFFLSPDSSRLPSFMKFGPA